MSNTRTIILLILLIFSLSGCKSGKHSGSSLPPIIMFEKTACMGTCPSYIFKAYPDGKVTLTGREYVDLIGEYEAELSTEELGRLRQLFEEAGFFSFANVYSANLEDLPTTYLYYDNGRQNAKVTDYYGAPPELKALEEKIHRFIWQIDWQKKE